MMMKEEGNDGQMDLNMKCIFLSSFLHYHFFGYGYGSFDNHEINEPSISDRPLFDSDIDNLFL